LDPAKSLEPGNQAAARAIELDNTLAEGHLVNAASIFTNRWDWKASEQEIAHTIALDPRFAEAYHLHAKMLGALNRNEEAIAAQKKATELDPFSRPWALALAYLVARQYDAGLKDGRLRLELSPRDPSLFGIMADLYRSKGIDKEAADMMVKMFQFSDNQASAAAVQRAYQRGGYKAVVRWQLDQAKTRSPRHYVSPVYLAGLYAQLGDREKTLTLLEQGFREHSPLLLWIQSNPAYDFLHVEPRYRSLIQRIGLPPAW
jgi:tetratricopeptide (TPR) repeat protein